MNCFRRLCADNRVRYRNHSVEKQTGRWSFMRFPNALGATTYVPFKHVVRANVESVLYNNLGQCALNRISVKSKCTARVYNFTLPPPVTVNDIVDDFDQNGIRRDTTWATIIKYIYSTSISGFIRIPVSVIRTLTRMINIRVTSGVFSVSALFTSRTDLDYT